jgi:hypothetical protein
MQHIPQEDESTVLEENVTKQPTDQIAAEPINNTDSDDVGQCAFAFIAVIIENSCTSMGLQALALGIQFCHHKLATT